MSHATGFGQFGGLYQKWANQDGHLYPTEWVVRTLLGQYPRLYFGDCWRRMPVLDLGFGDGRNFSLLLNMGVDLYAVEPDQEIIKIAEERFKGRPIKFSDGNNSELKFEDSKFSGILACHSCYYIMEGQEFSDNIFEIARVLRPGGRFVFSLPRIDNFIFHAAEDLGNGLMRVRSDPYVGRHGSLMQSFETDHDVERHLFQKFTNIRLGSLIDDYYGIRLSCFIGVAERRS